MATQQDAPQAIQFHISDKGSGSVGSDLPNHSDVITGSILTATDKLGTTVPFFFSRTCLSTYFIKKKAVYRHNLMLAKQELTGTSTQRSNNREKIEKRPTKTNSHSTNRTTTTEQKTSPTHQDPRNNLTQMNLHEEQHHRGRQLTTKTTNGWPSIHQNKQLHSGEASARDDHSAAQTRLQKHPPE